jgi:hypothetical protein
MVKAYRDQLNEGQSIAEQAAREGSEDLRNSM